MSNRVTCSFHVHFQNHLNFAPIFHSEMDSSWHFEIRDTLSGMVGAACLVLAGAPFDIVKIRLQTQAANFRSPLHCAQTMFKKEGLLSFWKGAGPAFASATVENAVAFTVNGFLRRTFLKLHNSDQLSLTDELLIGALGGFCSATAICPAEVVKCRMQYAKDTKPYSSTLNALITISRVEGFRGLFAGLQPLLMRDVPFNALFFGGYRAYLPLLTSAFGSSKDDSHVFESFLAGGFAGMTAWAIVFPFDVIKSRLQVASPGTPTTSTLSALRHIVAVNGFMSLYRGASPAILRGFPANAALFGGQHAAEHLLRRFDI